MMTRVNNLWILPAMVLLAGQIAMAASWSYNAHAFPTYNGVSLVPLRAISEGLGAKVTYDALNEAITVLDGRHKIVLYLHSTIAYLDTTTEQMPAPAIMREGKTYVPLRFLAETLGAVVQYNDEAGQVTVTRK